MPERTSREGIRFIEMQVSLTGACIFFFSSFFLGIADLTNFGTKWKKWKMEKNVLLSFHPYYYYYYYYYYQYHILKTNEDLGIKIYNKLN